MHGRQCDATRLCRKHVKGAVSVSLCSRSTPLLKLVLHLSHSPIYRLLASLLYRKSPKGPRLADVVRSQFLRWLIFVACFHQMYLKFVSCIQIHIVESSSVSRFSRWTGHLWQQSHPFVLDQQQTEAACFYPCCCVPSSVFRVSWTSLSTGRSIGELDGNEWRSELRRQVT